MQNKINLSKIIFAFAVLYCIIPNYIKIASIPLNYIFATMSIVLIIYSKQSIIFMKYGSRFFIFINLLLIIPMLYHKEYLNSFTNLVVNIVLVLYLFYYIDSKHKFIELINCIIIGAFILEIISLFEFVLKINLFELLSKDYIFVKNINSYRFGLLRISSSFYNPINYCVFLFFISILIMYKSFINDEFKGYSKFDKFVYFLTMICGLMTMSRGPLLIMIIINLLLYNINTNFTQKVKLTFKIIGIIIIIIVSSYIFNINIMRILTNVMNMIFSVFSENIRLKISDSFGTNVQAVGNRLDLYKWVIQELKGFEIWGKGVATQFSYIVNNLGHKKTSIENQYLLQLFRYGYVGLILYIIMLISCLKIQINSFKDKKFNEKYSFTFIMSLITAGYILIMFMVSVGEEVKLFYILIVLTLSYIYNLKNSKV